MNRYFKLVPICIVISLIIGCSKNDKSSPSSSASSSSSNFEMSATIMKQADSSLFSAAGPSLVIAIDSNYECKIIASDTLADTVVSKFTLTILDYSGVGTYSFDSSIYYRYAVYETMNPYTQTAFAQCTVKISTVTAENISGTFSGTLTDGTIVTNGSFNAVHRTFQ